MTANHFSQSAARHFCQNIAQKEAAQNGILFNGVPFEFVLTTFLCVRLLEKEKHKAKISHMYGESGVKK